MTKKILADQFGRQKRWVIWRYETLKGKKTKIPYGVTGKKASSTDSTSWVDYKTAVAAVRENTRFDGVGIVFTPSQTLLGIDIDHCLTGGQIRHADQASIQQLIASADTYCEVSPSGEGLHLFVQVDEPLTLEHNKRAPFEVYTSGRYFTVTNTPFGEVKTVRTVTIAEAQELLAIIGYPWTADVPTNHTPISIQSVHALSDEMILRKMFAAKNGDDIKTLYDGGLDAYAGDASKADMALLMHLAFWSGRNAEQMERLWMLAPLGAREKTQKRADYRTRSIAVAISHCKEIYKPPAHTNPDLDLLYTKNAQDKRIYTLNLENMCRILRKQAEFTGRFRYDIFKNGYEIRIDNTWREMRDTDALDIQTQISILFAVFQRVGKDLVYDAMVKVSKENECDSAVDFLTSLQWDGKPRLDTWLVETYGTPDDAYHRAVGSNWFKGLVKRLVEPGCKFDYVLVLEGRQGAKKSMSLSVLGGDWHLETTMSTDTKDFFMQFQSNAIIEFSEGETLSRTEVKRMKAIITTQYDKFRPPYGRATVSFPRRCVFAMTTNQEEYLKDETGNRRWLPVRVVLPQANIEWLTENRSQLYAEAYERVAVRRETVYEFPEDETNEEQRKRRVEDPNGEAIMYWYYSTLQAEGRARGVTVFQAVRDALHSGVLHSGITKGEQMSIAMVFRDYMGLRREKVRENGVLVWKWFNDTDVPVEESITASRLTF